MLLHPTSEPELVEILRDAGSRGARVRVVGSRHSVKDAYQTVGSGVGLDHFRSIRDLDGGRVMAGGGATIRQLVDHLDRRGLALPNLGGITAQTVAGFIATGSEGGSLRHSLASSIAAVRLVTATGEIVDIDREHRWFDAVGVSLGLLGIVVAVTFQCEPSYGVAGREDSRDFGSLRADFVRHAEEHDYFRALWYPAIDHCHVWHGDRIAVPDDSAGLERFGATKQLLVNAASFVGTRARPLLVRPLLRCFVKEARRRFHGPWHDVLPQDDGLSFRFLPHVYCELWVPIGVAPDALEALARYFQRAGLDGMPTLPVEFYCAPENDFWISPGHGRRSLRINLIRYGHDPRSNEALFEGPWRALAPFEPRAHWGKFQFHSEELALRNHVPRLEDFLELRKAVDPGGVFLTPYWERALGIERPSPSTTGARNELVPQGESP